MLIDYEKMIEKISQNLHIKKWQVRKNIEAYGLAFYIKNNYTYNNNAYSIDTDKKGVAFVND